MGRTPFPTHICLVKEGEYVTDSTLMGETNTSPLSSETITIKLPFALLSEDQVMADVPDRQQDELRGLSLLPVPYTEPHGTTGATLRDGSLG